MCQKQADCFLFGPYHAKWQRYGGPEGPIKSQNENTTAKSINAKTNYKTQSQKEKTTATRKTHQQIDKTPRHKNVKSWAGKSTI